MTTFMTREKCFTPSSVKHLAGHRHKSFVQYTSYRLVLIIPWNERSKSSSAKSDLLIAGMDLPALSLQLNGTSEIIQPGQNERLHSLMKPVQSGSSQVKIWVNFRGQHLSSGQQTLHKAAYKQSPVAEEIYFLYLNRGNKPPLWPADLIVFNICDGLDREVGNSQLGCLILDLFLAMPDNSCYTSKLWVFVLSQVEQWDCISSEDQAVEDSAEPQHLFLHMDPSHTSAP